MYPVKRLVLPVSLFTLFLIRHHLYTLFFRILPVYVFWSSYANNGIALSLAQDGFDQSFAKYPINQWSSVWPPLDSEGEEAGTVRQGEEAFKDVVPPVLHHILLGMQRETMPITWEESRNKCLEYVFRKYPLIARGRRRKEGHES